MPLAKRFAASAQGSAAFPGCDTGWKTCCYRHSLAPYGLAFLAVLGDKRLRPQPLENIAQPRLMPLGAVSEAVEEPYERFERLKYFLRRDELLQQHARHGVRPQPAAGVYRKTLLAVSYMREEARIINGSESAVGAATGESRLELARQSIGTSAWQKILRRRDGVRRDIEVDPS